jgi:acetylornithine deacetylase/succinyl-diaminopimelate desuccinylase-like protein
VDPLPALQSAPTFTECTREGSQITVRFTGKDAFGGTPRNGVNAVLTGAVAVQKLLRETDSSDSLVDFLADYFAADFDCTAMGLFCEDTNYGPITSNVGILTYREGEVSHTFDTRIPPLFQTNDILAKLEEFCGKHGVRVEAVKNIPSTYTPADSEYCRTIAGAFESITGIHPRFYTSGGRTYAVELGERALAYGPVGTAPVGHCHGNDEYISLKALQDLAGIYYETVRRLFC